MPTKRAAGPNKPRPRREAGKARASADRVAGDFESAVLHALNGGGQNMSRACLTGALAGAQVGLGSGGRSRSIRFRGD
jgi:hypothetical protein